MATVPVDDTESTYSWESPKVRESDLKRKQVARGWTLLWLAYQATGVIHGDIGTSPLYVYSSTFSSNPSREDVLGAVSLIIWTLTLMVSVKYVFIVLYADNEGEGGTFAVYTLLSRYCQIATADPRTSHLTKMERHATNELPHGNRGVRTFLEKSKIARIGLQILAVGGVSLLLADGVLTPAQSVLGAIQGIEVATPDISNSVIVGVSCGILVVLFVLQPLGIHRISSAFAPIVIIWLLFNAAFGIYNLALHDYTVLKAFSPYFAGDWFVRNGTTGWLNLGGILLAFTGVETLFADLGAFTRGAIRLSWFALAYPCLLLAYIGQGAYMLDDPSAWSNPFFKTVPPGMFYPSLVFAILAAVVASQATITGCFQLLTQIMSSSYFPQLRVKHTSDTFHGQVYIPVANWILMVGTVIVTAVYNNTTKIGHAYGACVVLVTFITTNMIALVAVTVWRIHPAIVLLVWLPFVSLDGLYLSSVLTKVPDGAWFTIMLAAVLTLLFALWRYGKESQWARESQNRIQLADLLNKPDSNGRITFTSLYGGYELANIDGFGIFFDKSGCQVPEVFEEWLKKFHAQTNVGVLVHLRALDIPRVSSDDRIEIIRTGLPNVYRVILRHGYKEHSITPDLAHLIYGEIRKAILAGANICSDPRASDSKTEGQMKDVAITQCVQTLDSAFEKQHLYIVGKQHMRVSAKSNIARRMLLETYLWIRENTRSKFERWDIPIGDVVQVGFVREI
ncbi:Hypothetical protein R9X50_00558500 [Acrodontium crateriforme]|uniref:Potassium transporter n=1 Tax=Acrodontium crateriforme TaxID=150365 RepID=A0AAQ3MCQ7_9PEZI|nr:Hypothetical protein R9X50_00558500 [Acrodontium crateriforme]